MRAMRLMQSQLNEILTNIDESSFRRGDFDVAHTAKATTIAYIDPRLMAGMAIRAESAETGVLFEIKFSPGADAVQEDYSDLRWDTVLRCAQIWLAALHREVEALDRKAQADEAAPEWAIQELPPVYAETLQAIAAAEEQERRLRRLTVLLRDPLKYRW